MNRDDTDGVLSEGIGLGRTGDYDVFHLVS